MTKREKHVLYAAAAVGLMSNGGMILSPALSSIMAHFSEIPPMFVQMLITVPALMMIPASIVAGYLCRKISFRRIFQVCLAVLALAGILPFLLQNFVVVFCSRIAVGIAIGSMTPLANALIANNFTGLQKDRAIGIYTASESIGGAVMVFLSGVIFQFGWRYNFLVYLIAVGQFILVTRFCPPGHGQGAEGERPSKSSAPVINPTVCFVWVVFFIYMTYLNTFATHISQFVEGEGIGTSAVCGVVSSVFLVSGFVCGLVYSKITAVFRGYTFVFGLGITAVGMLLVANSHHALVVIPGSIISGFGMGVTLPTGNLMSAASVCQEKSASAIALGASAYQLAQFMTPFLVAPTTELVLGADSIRGRFGVSAAILCIWTGLVFFATWLFRKKITPKGREQH